LLANSNEGAFIGAGPGASGHREQGTRGYSWASLILIGLCFLLQSSLSAQSGEPWHFAVAGDSRNCGDIVMPGIAASVKENQASFYWHLGDMRWIYFMDEDMSHRKPLPKGRYRAIAWDDVIQHQLSPFSPVDVFVGIGNHETALTSNRSIFVEKFRQWLPEPNSYYHFVKAGVDFIYLDNATSDEFSERQVRWLEERLEQDRSDAGIHTIVVGMHEALPHSIAGGHSMNKSGEGGKRNGILVYKRLLEAKRDGKFVYVLASHSHYYSPDLFKTKYWEQHGGVLDGWIVGTAGARKYALPSHPPAGATNSDYGYLLATVNPPGSPIGTISFEFKRVNEADVPETVRTEYPQSFVDWCFRQNGRSRVAARTGDK
jgi:Calcineurin-like phosphoesterase